MLGHLWTQTSRVQERDFDLKTATDCARGHSIVAYMSFKYSRRVNLQKVSFQGWRCWPRQNVDTASSVYFVLWKNEVTPWSTIKRPKVTRTTRMWVRQCHVLLHVAVRDSKVNRTMGEWNPCISKYSSLRPNCPGPSHSLRRVIELGHPFIINGIKPFPSYQSPLNSIQRKIRFIVSVSKAPSRLRAIVANEWLRPLRRYVLYVTKFKSTSRYEPEIKFISSNNFVKNCCRDQPPKCEANSSK